MKRALLLLVLLLGLAAGLLSEPSDADVVLTNGNIYTVDVRLGRVEAIAITRGKIAAVGTAEEMQHWVGPETKVIDLEGKFVMPGFNDAHTHLANAGQGSLSVNVEGTRSVADFQERIRARLSEFEPGTWVVGRGWDHSLWEENRMPTRADLDAVSTSHPMFFTRVDGHSAVANSLALERAGITRSSEQPEGGEIVRDGWIAASKFNSFTVQKWLKFLYDAAACQPSAVQSSRGNALAG
ncbi:MAG: amidohydrolase family protein [Acidobacteria bacterium]|nr:amidohydrolase family protein [Acidobacteriota bacterium]